MAKPSHGYRAKHLVVKVGSRRVEIQIRTRVQHQWALLSENAADLYDQEIKYGAGDPVIVRGLLEFSDDFKEFDDTHLSINLLNLLELRVKEMTQQFLKMRNDLLH